MKSPKFKTVEVSGYLLRELNVLETLRMQKDIEKILGEFKEKDANLADAYVRNWIVLCHIVEDEQRIVTDYLGADKHPEMKELNNWPMKLVSDLGDAALALAFNHEEAEKLEGKS